MSDTAFYATNSTRPPKAIAAAARWTATHAWQLPSSDTSWPGYSGTSFVQPYVPTPEQETAAAKWRLRHRLHDLKVRSDAAKARHARRNAL